MPLTRLARLPAFAAAILTLACGGDGATEPRCTPPPTSGAVNVCDNSFSPQGVTVQVNGTVTWTWTGLDFHNVTFAAGGPLPSPCNSTTRVCATDRTMGSYTGTFTVVGTYNYTCTNHFGMNGKVIVVN